jgi:hypothetical protein
LTNIFTRSKNENDLSATEITDPAVLKMADILRAADINTLRGTVAEAEGVRAIVHGFFLLNLPDGESLALQLPVFDALYCYCQALVLR